MDDKLKELADLYDILIKSVRVDASFNTTLSSF
jgi:hypothetical protein